VRSVVLAAAVAVVAAACSGGNERGAPRDFCESVAKFDEEVATATVDEQQELLETVVEHAPREIRPDAETFLEGYERREEGEDVIADEDRYEEAAENLQRYSIDNCGLLDQNPPGGGI
jgi:hypothetical protein